MNMNELRRSLAQLHAEIARVKDRSGQEFTELNELLSQLERQLTAAEHELDPPTLSDQVREQVGRFEVEHPRITGILNDILVTLSNLGI